MGTLTALALAVTILGGSVAAAAGSSKLRVKLNGPVEVATASTVALRAKLSRHVGGARVTLESRTGGRWVGVQTHRPRRRLAHLTLRAPASAGFVVVRAVAQEGKRTIARSPAKTILVRGRETQPDERPVGEPVPGREPVRVDEGSVSYTVPLTTKLYDGSQIESVVAAGNPEEAVVTLASAASPPAVGGHVALGPAPGLPDGMFAEVLATQGSGGGVQMHLRRAAIDEVLEQVSIDFAGHVDPILVDENGAPVGEEGPIKASGRGVVLRGTAVFAGAPRGSALAGEAMFVCSGEGGIPREPADVWETGNPFPLELQIQNTEMTHVFDSGSIFPQRDPFVLVQLSGEAVASIGFEAKAGFECELSPQFRQNHRLKLRLPSIGPVPVSLYLEPALELDASGSGKIALSQRHHFAFTLKKSGFDPLEASRAYSRDPATLRLTADLSASLFAGGDLSLMVGGGVGNVKAEAGLAGAFGPEVTLEPAQTAGCVDVNASFEAALQARLELWVKRWDFELATLTVGKTRIVGPKCVFDTDVSDEVIGPSVGPPGPPAPFTRETNDDPGSGGHSEVAFPMGDGRWLAAERLADTAWRYVVLSESGAEMTSWNASYDPNSVVSAPDGTTFLMGLDRTGSDLLHLVRIAPGGASRKTKTFDPSPFAPGIQHLALSPSGRLFWLYSLPPGTTQGVAEVDVTTLQRISSKPLGFSNGGITPTPTELVVNSYASTVWRIPYGVFSPNDDSPYDFGQPSASPNSEHSDRLIAVGTDGTVADVGYFPYDCEERSVSRRGPDGMSWERKLGALLGAEEPAGCEIQDLDVLPDGQLVATLVADDGTYHLRIDRDGDANGLLKVGDDDVLVSTVVDAAGTAFTAYTRITECEPEDSQPNCADVRVARVSDSALQETAILGGPQQVIGAGSYMVGLPYLAIGKNQAMVSVFEQDRFSGDFCRRYCGALGTAQLRTAVMSATLGGRASRSWWGG